MIDFLVLTALPKEFDPLRNQFDARRLPKNHNDIYEYYDATISVDNCASYSVRLFCVRRKGAQHTTAALTRAIRRWKPRYVIMTGIAATVPGERRQIGHILVADIIVDLSEWKVFPKKEIPRPDTHKCDQGLLQSIDAFVTSRTDVETGIIVAQNNLIKSAKHRDALINVVKNITGRSDVIGIEMEGGGLGAGIETESSDTRPGYILIKGAVDFANYHKNDIAQRQAAKDAAKFVHNFLRFGPIPIDPNTTNGDEQSLLPTAKIDFKDTKKAIPTLFEIENRLQIHNRNIFSEIGFSADSTFVPVRNVYVERTKAQSTIDTKLVQALAEPHSNLIVAVTGLAGSGKTSLLDDLSRRASGKAITPFIVRSEDLTEVTGESGYFETRFRDFISDDKEPAAWQVMRKISERFSHAHRSLLLMIDTVDYLVVQDAFSWRSFYSLLLELTSLRSVIICMTCRPYEFEHIKTDQFVEVPLENLTDEEILIALNKYTDCFYKNADSKAQKRRLRHRAESDDKFRRLVADPLKLRMLFEAYSGREIFAEEINTAKLYDRFWRVKIWSESRRPLQSNQVLSPLPTAKDNIYRTVAFGLLVDKRLEFEEPRIVRNEFDSTYGRAWSELRSDAVIHQPIERFRKYQFFHETFFEYAAARHIASSENSAIAADWLIRHFAEKADFFVVPIISHLAALDSRLSFRIVQGLYTGKTDMTDPLFTKRLATEIFTNVDEPERSAVGDYLLNVCLSDQNQIILESLIQRAGHLPSSSICFAMTLLETVWRNRKTDRIHLLVLQALADLSRVDSISVWKWIEDTGSDVLTFDEGNREGFGTKISITLEVFANCYRYNPELITKKMLGWYEVAGETSRVSIISVLLSFYGTSSGPIWTIVIDKFRGEARADWGIKIARAIGETLTKLPKGNVANVVPDFMKMLEEKGEVSRRAAVVLGTLAANPRHEKLFRSLWKMFLADDEHTGNLFIVFRQMAKDRYSRLVRELNKAPIDENSQLLDLLTECPLCAPLPLERIEHLAENTNTRMKMALARALVKSAAIYTDAHSFLRDLIETRWAGRERAYAIGAMEKLNNPQAEDMALLMRLYPTFDAKAKLSCGKTISRWFRTIRNDAKFVTIGSDAIRILIEDDSTAVKEAALEALTVGTELIPIFSQAILKVSSSSATGVRLKSIPLLRSSGNEQRLVTIAKADSDENLRREAVLEIARSFSGEQLTAYLSSAENEISSENSTGVLRAWCFAASSAARANPQISSDATKAVIRRAAHLRLSKEAQKDIGRNAAHTIHLLVQADRESDGIFSGIVQTAKEALGVFSGSQHLVIGMIEGLTRGVSINDERLQSILRDSAIPEACKEPIYNKQKEMRRTTHARLTELDRIIGASENS